MAEIHKSGEDYIEAILVLKRENGIARSVDVAKKRISLSMKDVQ